MSKISFKILRVSAPLREMISRFAASAIAALVCFLASNCFAKGASVETVLTGLNTPYGIAVRPGGTAESCEVFVADSTGTRVVKLQSDKVGTSTDAITGFDCGPSALFFLDRDHLAVGCGKQPAVRLYELADESVPIAADKARQVIDEPAVETVFAFARTRQNDKVPDMLILACIGDGWSAGLGKIPVRAETLGKPAPLVGIVQVVRDSSFCVAVSEQGQIAAVQSDQAVEPGHYKLTYFDPTSGKAVVSYPLPFKGPVLGLAYSNNYRLYAIIKQPSADGGGLYRLDDVSKPGKPGCSAVKIVAIENATDLAFAPDGTVYITVTPADGRFPKHGKVIRIRGDL